MAKRPHPCPVDAGKFHRLVNMSPKEILAWAKDPRAKCASFEATRRRLPHLARLKAKNKALWDQSDCNYARRVNSYNARAGGSIRKHGCTVRAVVAARNWGMHPPKCGLPPKNCAHRPPRT